MQSKHIFVFMLVFLTPITGCIGGEDSDDAIGPIAKEGILPDLTAPNQYGENITLSDMQGDMLVILINMGGWCHVCFQSTENATALIEQMEALDDRYNVNFVEVLGSDDTWEGVANQTYAMNWSVEYNTSHHILHSEAAQNYTIEMVEVGWPTYLIVDPDGVMRLEQPGVNSITAEDVQEQYELYLSEKEDSSSDS